MKDKRKYLRVGFYAAIVLSFLIVMSALWLHRVFFSPDNLAEITTEVLQEESNRNAISSAIVDRVFEDRPVLASIAGPRLVPVVSGLLGSDVAANAFTTTTERLRVALTTDSTEDITVNLVPIKTTITTVQTTIGQTDEERRINPEDIPDEIVLLDRSNFPNYSDEGIVVLWLGPIAFTFLVVGAGVWIYRGRKIALGTRVRIIAILAAISSIIALLIGPLTEPIIVQYAKNIEGQTIVGNLYEAILAPFNAQAVVLLVVAVLAYVLTYLLPWSVAKVKARK